MLDIIIVVGIITLIVLVAKVIMKNNQDAVADGRKKGHPGPRSKFEYKFNGDIERLKYEINEIMDCIKYKLTRYGDEQVFMGLPSTPTSEIKCIKIKYLENMVVLIAFMVTSGNNEICLKSFGAIEAKRELKDVCDEIERIIRKLDDESSTL